LVLRNVVVDIYYPLKDKNGFKKTHIPLLISFPVDDQQKSTLRLWLKHAMFIDNNKINFINFYLQHHS